MTQSSKFDQVELERLRRLRLCYDVDRPTSREVARAVADLGSRRDRSHQRRALRVLWVAAAGLLLTAGAVAASHVLNLGPLAPAPVRTANTPKASSTSQRFSIARKGRSTDYDRPVELSLSPGERAVLTVGGTRSELVGPGTIRVAPAPSASWTSTFTPQGLSAELVGKIPPTVVPPASASAIGSAVSRPAPSADRNLTVLLRPRAVAEERPTTAASDDAGRAWARAAAALRIGDHEAAQRSLSELSRSPDATTRDAALLAQAELDLGTGSTARAVSVLKQLAETGATPFVRQRAREILNATK